MPMLDVMINSCAPIASGAAILSKMLAATRSALPAEFSSSSFDQLVRQALFRQRTSWACASTRLRFNIFLSGYKEKYCHCGHSLVTQRPRMVSIPANTSSNRRRGILRTRSVRTCLSRATIRETFATEFCGNPVSALGSRTFPGASAHLRLLVMGTHSTVAMRLRLMALHWTTRTGRRYPVSDPAGSSRSAHQTSDCSITTRPVAGHVAQHVQRRGRFSRPLSRWLDS